MKAAVCYEFNKPLVVEEVDLAAPVEGEVKVRLAATAVCHSDIHDMKGELPGPVPFVGGHESAGYIEETGPGVTSVKAGDPVVVSLLAYCMECYYCITGLPHLCLNKFTPPKAPRLHNKQGQPLGQQCGVGGFAEYVVVKESQVVTVPADMPLDRAGLLACGVITGFGGVGNRATESLLSPGPTEGESPAPSLELDPMGMLFKQMVEDEGRIRSWLDEHTEKLRGLSLRAIVRRVRDSVSTWSTRRATLRTARFSRMSWRRKTAVPPKNRISASAAAAEVSLNFAIFGCLQASWLEDRTQA